jgi:hypothetical protein
LNVHRCKEHYILQQMDLLPFDIIKHILTFDCRFIVRNGQILTINPIAKTDERYNILLTMPLKEYDYTDGVTYVYMCINEDKDYYITYKPYELQIQVLYYEVDSIYNIDGHIHYIT